MVDETNNSPDPVDELNNFIGMDSSVLDLAETRSTSIQKRYGFKLGETGLLVPAGALTEAVKIFNVYPVPKTKPWFKGLTNIRGNLVPVYDLGLLLGITVKPVKMDKLLVYGKNTECIGILIEDLPKAYDVCGWSVLNDLSGLPVLLKEYVIENYSVDEVVWLSFDHGRFFEAIKSNIPI